MFKLFTYSSKTIFNLPENHEGLVEKMTLELKKKLSAYSGEDAERSDNTIYFAITPSGVGIQFIGLDSGQIKIDVKDKEMIVNYRLSYLSPFVPFLILDLVLILLSSLIHPDSQLSGFTTIITMFLGFYVVGIIVAIVLFPGIIHDAWHSVNRKYSSS
jgi:hypothetical protein